MKLFRLFPVLAAVLMAGSLPVSAQEAAADPAPAEAIPAPAEPAPAEVPATAAPATETPAVEPVPAPPLPEADPDPAATPVAPRDLTPPTPAEGGAAPTAPVDPAMIPDLSPPEPATPAKKPAVPKTSPASKKTGVTRPAPASAEAVVVTIRVGGNGPKESFLISLRPDLAPKTVENFKRNIESGFYEGLAFHRLIRNYIIQTGDPLTKDDAQKEQWGTSDIGQNIPGEFGGSHVRYSVAMAHKPGESTSSGSQFFIALRPATSLDGSYAVFGEVTQGTDVLNRLSGSVVDTNDVPVKRIEIVDAKIVRGDTQLAESTTVGARRKTKPDSQKGRIEKFIERVW